MIQPGTDCEFLFILQFGAPEFDGPVERGRQKQVGKINLGEGRKEGRDRRNGEREKEREKKREGGRRRGGKSEREGGMLRVNAANDSN